TPSTVSSTSPPRAPPLPAACSELVVIGSSEIGVEHSRVGPNLLGRAGLQRTSLVQHGHLMTQPHHELHVVLDHEERLAGSIELANPLGQLLDQGRVHSGC